MPSFSRMSLSMPPFSLYAVFSLIWLGTNILNIDKDLDLSQILSESIEQEFKSSCARPTFFELINYTAEASQCHVETLYDDSRSDNGYDSWNQNVSHQWQVSLWLRKLCHTLPNFLALSNMGYCCLIVLAKIIFRVFFGELRSQEKSLMREKILHFFFYNLLYIFILSYVRTLQGVFLWGSWISILCFLHLLTALSASRFDHLTYSPSTTWSGHVKLITLLICILTSSLVLCFVGLYVGLNTSNHVLFFMLTKSIIVILLTCHVLVQYGIHLYDNQYGGFWLARGSVKYYTDLCFDLVSLSIDFCHHLHLLVWRNIFLSAASLMVLMQLRYLLCELTKRMFRHRNYRRLARLMDERFPLVKSVDDICAICWSPLTVSRQLPCRHNFHDTCVRAWLEQDSSCPTCREVIAPLNTNTAPSNHTRGGGNNAATPTHPNIIFSPMMGVNRVRNPARRTTHFFHLDGSRYFSWLPTLRVEVSQVSEFGGAANVAFGDRHMQNRLAVEPTVGAGGDHFDEGIQQVLSIFPHVPHSVIRDDLLQSGSVEATIENILEGRLFETSAAESTDASAEPDQTEAVESSKPSTSCESTLSGGAASVEHSPEHLDLVADPSISVNGSRFSKSAREREAILAVRKKEMLLQAKRRYLTNNVTTEN